MTQAHRIAATTLLVTCLFNSSALPQPAAESAELGAAAPRGAELGLAIADATLDQRSVNPSPCVNPWSQHDRCRVPL
jgi:hypothetical protein